MNLANRLIKLTEELERDISGRLIQTLTQIRACILGLYDKQPCHPDSVDDVYGISGNLDTRPLQYELNISKDDLLEWVREISYAIYNGMDMEGMNSVNAKYGMPPFPLGYYDNVPMSFSKPFGELTYHKLTEPTHD